MLLGNPFSIPPVLAGWVVATSAPVVSLCGLSGIELQGKRETEGLEITLEDGWDMEAAENNFGPNE